jgi:FAD/FMN-containing dehydrogenase
MNDFFAAVESIVGSSQLLTAANDVARYDSDGRGAGSGASGVIRPGSAAEVAAVLEAGFMHGVSIVPQGARTGLSGAGTAQGGLLLSLERLARTPLIDSVNRTAEVDAGVLLSSLNAAAAQHRLTFPIDLGADPSIGGMIAANTGGARFLRYGDVRRNLLAVEVALSDGRGTLVQLGRNVWKDNGGLELKQLFASSSGSMGVITRATLALQPLPSTRMTALVSLSEASVALALLVEMERQAGALLTAFEGISHNAFNLAFAHVPNLQRPFETSPPYAVLIELSGGDGLSAEQMTDIIALVVQPFIESGAVVDVAIDLGDRLWRIRHALTEGLRAEGTVIACDIAVPRSVLMKFREEATREIAMRWPALMIADFGHVGDGGLHFNMVWPYTAGRLPDDLPAIVQSYVFERAVRGYGGTFSAEHGVGPRNFDHYVRFTPESVRSLATKVQKAIAPVPLGRVNFG